MIGRNAHPLVEGDIHFLDSTLNMEEETLRSGSHAGNADRNTDCIGNKAHKQSYTVVEESTVVIDCGPDEHGEEANGTSSHKEQFLDTCSRIVGDGKHDDPAHQCPWNPVNQECVGVDMKGNRNDTAQQTAEETGHTCQNSAKQHLNDAQVPLSATNREERQEQRYEETDIKTKCRQITQTRAILSN